MTELSFPSKTFLLGEYAVLHGDVNALLLGHAPHFRARFTPGAPSSPFHPESPAGRWLARHPLAGALAFEDPHAGRGGFGASGAEFLAAWASARAIPRTEDERRAFAWDAWRDSRDFPGSGADILTQAFGVNETGNFLLSINLPERALARLRPNTGGRISLFHTGRKLATHENLKTPPLPLEQLNRISANALGALLTGQFSPFALALGQYGQTLARLGLLAEHSRAALAALPAEKVLAAKGCGAMGADVLLVAHVGANLAPWAEANSLTPIGTFSV